MAGRYKMINGVLTFIDDGQGTAPQSGGQDTSQLLDNARQRQQGGVAPTVSADTQQVQNAEETQKQTTPPSNIDIPKIDPSAVDAPNTSVNSAQASLSPLEQAQKAYADAVAKRNEGLDGQIQSYQDIIDRYGAPETKEDAQAREAKEQRKRNLLAMIQLGANIGNMVNATTGGHMGSRSVETPNLVDAYDKARATELTHRMKRDEKRNAARQAMINLKASAAQSDAKNAFANLQQAQKADLEKQKAQDKADLEKFKADNAAKENQAKRDWNTWKATLDDKHKWANLAETKRYHKALEDARDRTYQLNERKFEELKKNGGSGNPPRYIPVTVEGEDNVYKVPEYVFKDPYVIEGLAVCLPPKYTDKITSSMTVDDIKKVIADYAMDIEAHQGKYTIKDSDGKEVEVDAGERYERFKELLGNAAGRENNVQLDSGAPVSSWKDFADWGKEEEDDGIGNPNSFD